MPPRQLILFVGRDFVSVFGMSAYVALVEKGLDFEIQKVDLKVKAQLQPCYRDISLTCRVPTLIHNGFCLSESSAIAEYLEDAFPAPNQPAVLPNDVQQRARARQIQAWLRSDLQPLRSERPADLFYMPGEVKPLSGAAQLAADKLVRIAQTLLAGNRSHLFGDWCIADTDLAVMLQRLVFNKDPVPLELQRYVELQWNRESVTAWRNQLRD